MFVSQRVTKITISYVFKSFFYECLKSICERCLIWHRSGVTRRVSPGAVRPPPLWRHCDIVTLSWFCRSFTVAQQNVCRQTVSDDRCGTWNNENDYLVIGGSKAGQSGHAPVVVLGRGLPPPQAAEGIVKGQWIVEISLFFSLASLAIILKI